jgi:hypothetical protein
MGEIKDKMLNLITYSTTGAGIIVNWDSIGKVILFFGGLFLLSLQIYLHLLKVKQERETIKQRKNERKNTDLDK